MLELDQDLPAGALLDSARAEFRATLATSSVLWFEGVEDAFQIDPKTSAVEAWNSTDKSRSAFPTEPNEGNGLLAEAGDIIGLQCKPTKHCGLVASNITSNASRFTMAVIYLPPETGGARTLLTVNTGYNGGPSDEANYLFLSDGADEFTVKDTTGAVEITAPVTSKQNAPRMAIVTLSGHQLSLAENLNAPMTVQGTDPGMAAGADLFIGCRSQRKGLQKTLGGAIILDVIFWPDHALLAPRTEDELAHYTALKRYFLWGY